MLEKRHGKQALAAHAERCAEVTQRAHAYDQRMVSEGVAPIYQFGEGVIQGEELTLSDQAIGELLDRIVAADQRSKSGFGRAIHNLECFCAGLAD